MSCRGDVGGVFSEDAPRPPVPGQEGGVYCSKTASHWSEAPARRSGADLGFESEGSGSPDGPFEPWAETLLTLLEDRDGTALFCASCRRWAAHRCWSSGSLAVASRSFRGHHAAAAQAGQSHVPLLPV